MGNLVTGTSEECSLRSPHEAQGFKYRQVPTVPMLPASSAILLT